MSTLILMVGIEGSGRTKFARENLVHEGYILISAKEIKECLSEKQRNKQILDQVVKQEVSKKVSESLVAGKNVIWDDVHLTSTERCEHIKFAKDCGANQIVCYWMNLPCSRCAANIANKLVPTGKSPKEMGVNLLSLTMEVADRASALELPILDEGFDNLFEISESTHGLIEE